MFACVIRLVTILDSTSYFYHAYILNVRFLQRGKQPKRAAQQANLLNVLRKGYITILCVWAVKPDHHDMHNRFQQCPSPPTTNCTTVQIDVILRKYTHTMHMNLFMTNLSSAISTFLHIKHQPQQHVSMWWSAGYLGVHGGYVEPTETNLIDET